VGLYASRGFFYSQTAAAAVPDAIQALRTAEDPPLSLARRYYDLWGPSEGDSGAVKVEQVNVYPDLTHALALAPFERILAQPWWETNVFDFTAAGFPPPGGRFFRFAYEATNRWYVTTNILYEIARPLSAMRWTVTVTPLDYTQYEKRWSTNEYVQADEGYSVEPVIARLIAAWPTVAPDAGYWTGDIPTDAVITDHDISLRKEGTGSGANMTLLERVLFRREDFVPAATGLVRVVEFGYGHTLPGLLRAGVYKHGHFYSPRGYGTNRFEFLAGRQTNDVAAEVWVAQMVNLQTRIPVSEIDNTLTNYLVGAERDPETGMTVVDWAFRHLTNAPAFWGTSYGIR
jgi:hypothetical protein